jgi:predicted ABC-type ATPase
LASAKLDVWYAALASPELHIARVRARVAKGGHDIAERDIRKRYDTSRLNLVELLPGLSAVRVYDNSADGDPSMGKTPAPRLLLHMENHEIVSHCGLDSAPEWVRPILAAAFDIDPP